MDVLGHEAGRVCESDLRSEISMAEERQRRAQASLMQAVELLESTTARHELRAAWKHYCEVIDDLDHSTSELDLLQIGRI